MFRQFIIPLFLSMAFLSAPSIIHAKKSERHTINGSASLSDKTFKDLQVNGSVDFERVTIEKDLEVNGSVSGRDLTCESFEVSGSAALEKVRAKKGEVSGSLSAKDMIIEGKLEVDGTLKASKVTVQDVLDVSGNLTMDHATIKKLSFRGRKATIKDSTLEEIEVEETQHHPQKIILKGKTTVTGDIEFESGKGKVYLSGGAVVKGKVKGGKIIKGS